MRPHLTNVTKVLTIILQITFVLFHIAIYLAKNMFWAYLPIRWLKEYQEWFRPFSKWWFVMLIFLLDHLILHLELHYFFELHNLEGYCTRWVLQSWPITIIAELLLTILFNKFVHKNLSICPEWNSNLGPKACHMSVERYYTAP